MKAEFEFARSRALLEATPGVLRAWLGALPESLLHANEGAGTWSPFQVLCHLVHGETDDWLPRVRLVLERGTEVPFTPFDREAGFTKYGGWPCHAVLEELARLRRDNLAEVARLRISPEQLALAGAHPTLGRVTLGQLLACWVTHDQAHIAQIARVLTRFHGQFVGPWRAFFSLLQEPPPPA